MDDDGDGLRKKRERHSSLSLSQLSGFHYAKPFEKWAKGVEKNLRSLFYTLSRRRKRRGKKGDPSRERAREK